MYSSHDPNQPLVEENMLDEGVEEGAMPLFSIRLDGGPQCWF